MMVFSKFTLKNSTGNIDKQWETKLLRTKTDDPIVNAEVRFQKFWMKKNLER